MTERKDYWKSQKEYNIKDYSCQLFKREIFGEFFMVFYGGRSTDAENRKQNGFRFRFSGFFSYLSRYSLTSTDIFFPVHLYGTFLSEYHAVRDTGRIRPAVPG